MKKKLPTAEELVFEPFPYSETFPPIGCCICGKDIPPLGAYKADVLVMEKAEEPMTLAVCSTDCLGRVTGDKAGAVTAFILKEAGRLKRLFPKKDN